MSQVEITERDRRMAQHCLECPVCNYARSKQKGTIYWLVKNVEDRFCPFCRAYAKVYGRKAHEPLPDCADESDKTRSENGGSNTTMD